MNPKEIIELLSALRKTLPAETSQFYTDKDEMKCLKVNFLKITGIYNISDTATHSLWQFQSTETAALFIKDYMEPDTSSYFSFTIKTRE